MANEPTITMICIDVGMVGSTAAWRNNEASQAWRRVFDDNKVPTRLAYDTEKEGGTPVAWGKGCDSLPGQIKIYECFKAFMDEKLLPSIKPKLSTDVTRANIHRWMRDYMQLLCDHVVAHIDSNPKSGLHWRDATIHWIFAVPGSWAEFPTVADFRRLAGDAVYRCIGDRKGSKIIANITEAQAAAHFLLRHGFATSVHGCAAGNTVLSCDIGGATTDVAVSQIVEPEVLSTPMQLEMHPAGVAEIDSRFLLHAQHTLEQAGVPNSMEVAQHLLRREFQEAKHTFTGRQMDNWITLTLPKACEVKNWPPPGNATSTGTRIQCGVMGWPELLIHKDTMIEFFVDFVEGIEHTIDMAINKLKENGIPLTLIGVCGGGSRLGYLLHRLHQRFGDKVTVIDHRNYNIKPELATLIGSTMLCDQQTVRDFCKQTRFGIKRNEDDVFWGTLQEIENPSTLQAPYAMQVTFIENTHSVLRSIKHELVAVPQQNGPLETFSAALRSAGSRIWRVKINLSQVQSQTMSIHKTYNVICKISGINEVTIAVETDLPARSIGCVLI